MVPAIIAVRVAFDLEGSAVERVVGKGEVSYQVGLDSINQRCTRHTVVSCPSIIVIMVETDVVEERDVVDSVVADEVEVNVDMDVNVDVVLDWVVDVVDDSVDVDEVGELDDSEDEKVEDCVIDEDSTDETETLLDPDTMDDLKQPFEGRPSRKFRVELTQSLCLMTEAV